MTKQKTVKQVNYTDEMVSFMVETYTLATTDTERANAVEVIANKFGKHPASVRAKLSTLGVYVKPTPTTKAGKAITSKSKLVAEIAKKLEVQEEVIGSLEKATKVTLELLVKALAK